MESVREKWTQRVKWSRQWSQPGCQPVTPSCLLYIWMVTFWFKWLRMSDEGMMQLHLIQFKISNQTNVNQQKVRSAHTHTHTCAQRARNTAKILPPKWITKNTHIVGTNNITTRQKCNRKRRKAFHEPPHAILCTGFSQCTAHT